MDCTLATLIACFSWSNLYIDSGVSFQDTSLPHWEQQTAVIRHDWGTETFTVPVAADQSSNPYGRLSIGYEVNLSHLKWRLEASHTSSFATNRDRGVNAISINARWFPFR